MQIEISKVEKAIQDAENLISKLPEEISGKEGASSQKIRHLLNNLCSFDGARYLNVGLFTGSSFWAALFNNSVDAVGVDWWRNGTAAKCDEKAFWNNLCSVIALESDSFNRNIQVINGDCFSCKLDGKFNVYLYDAEHSEENQYKALTYFDKYLDDQFILLVDDFDDNAVRNGTFRAIKDLGYRIDFQWEGKGVFGDWNPSSNHWWNGFLVAVVSKKI